jgi:dihydroorotate dehydrogenase
MNIYKFLRPALFKLDPEQAHYLAMFLLKLVTPFIPNFTKSKPVKVAGLEFPNRVGLAAGFDKNAKWIRPLRKLGFGHIEIGTVTPVYQPGNEKPRMFRLPQDSALINRMGFNNDGSLSISKRLSKFRKRKFVIGGNIGKNKFTDENRTTHDYVYCFEQLWDHVDYFVVNVSSPNTPGLRNFQEKKPLTEILTSLQMNKYQKLFPKPIFLKIAPDLSHQQVLDILEVVQHTQIHGLVISNTTLDRSGLKSETLEQGGLSGLPLKQKSLELVRFVRSKNHNLAIIGVGGIFTAQDAKEYFEAGADLVQIYTGFIYNGPKLIRDITKL